MSEQMRTQIRGLGKAKQNGQDGQAALQIAEGGLAEITNLMQRQRELAIQAATDTLTETERKYLDDEFQELTKEVERIAKSTDYNGKNVLSYHPDPNLSFGAVGGVTADDKKAQVEAAIDKINEAFAKIDGETFTAGDFAANAPDGSTKDTDIYNKINDLLTKIKNTGVTGTDADIPTLSADAKRIEAVLKLDLTDFNQVYQTKDLGTDASNAQKSIETVKEGLQELRNAYFDLKAASGLIVSNNPGTAASYTLHVGPNYSRSLGGALGNEIPVTYMAVDIHALKLSKQQLTTQNNATAAIDQLDKVIKSISGVRAKIGTYINRLDYTVNNIASLEFNTQDAESRIRDTDFAKETTNFTRNQILVQSATSMLAQANSLPQSVLGLLG